MNDSQNTSPLPPSKSQRKRDMHALQDLGEQLISLNSRQLHDLPLPELLLTAINTAKAIKSHEARRRQLQYIGKLMRTVDAAPIQHALDALLNVQHQKVDQFHHLEQWRDRMLKEGDPAVNEFLQEFIKADRQQLRQLLRNAHKEETDGKPPIASRALFRYLRQLQEESK